MLAFNKTQIDTQNNNQSDTQHKIQNKSKNIHDWNKKPHATIFLTEGEETGDTALIYYIFATPFTFLLLNIRWYWLEKWLDDWYQCELAALDIAWLFEGIFYLLAYQVVILDEVRLAYVSNVRNSLKHTEKIPQPSFPTYKLVIDKKLTLVYNKNQIET